MTNAEKNEKAARFKFLNIESLLQSIDTWETNPDNFDPSLYTYLNRITLLSRDDQNEEDTGEVNIMTIHAAKGLEFPVVFIAGAEEGIIPHARSMEENAGDVDVRLLNGKHYRQLILLFPPTLKLFLYQFFAFCQNF